MAIPAMVNAHSHAFQRALRGAGEKPTGEHDSFWTWREVMYELAGTLDPASLREASAAAFAEMRAAGYGAVGEFHYLHHPDGMTEAVVAGAGDAGLPLVLLPAAYARGGHPRFRDDSLDGFLARAERVGAEGVAAHSVRAVPAEWLAEIARYADERGIVRHVHAAEQPRELEECAAEHGCSPIELLDRTGFLGPRTSVVHATHVTDRDVALLAETRTLVVICPTTEGNLGDGHAPALRLAEAGVRLAVGSDSNVRIDPFEEVRELETGARRQALSRTALLARTGDLWGELARNGAASLGLDAPGELEVDLDHPQLAGLAPEDLPWALATCASASVVRTPR
ncbi:MAG TPA: formimidoylglutamate deiminase [Solirubrobacteraceae bacterium]|nr:formimidoylglutamate deiminase [Solirubrobacteraceae bacterium]